MKVVAKLAAAFFAAACLCLLGFSYVAAKREAARVERSSTSDLMSVGVGLSHGASAVWRLAGKDEAVAILQTPTARYPDVAVGWVDRVPAAEDKPHAQTLDGAAGREVLVRVPIQVGEGGAWIELRRRLPSELAIVRDELLGDLLVAFVLAVMSVALVATLGAALIGRPLERVVAQARRIGAGDLSQRLHEGRRDEIGELKHELNVMCEQLVEAAARLEDESNARVETLEQLRHLDRLRTVGMLASSIAHELGTPLNVLLLRGQSLAASTVDPDARSAGEAIMNQVEKMSRIVRQLLDFARRAPATTDAVRLADVATSATRLITAVARKHHVDIHLAIESDARVLGNAVQLEQALTNLIVNGVHAMPEGGELHLVVAEDRTSSPPTVRIEVSDQGIGIDEATLERIFDPFFTTKKRGEGTGLGLHVTLGIVEEHGGKISARSVEGEGSTFTITLPRLS